MKLQLLLLPPPPPPSPVLLLLLLPLLQLLPLLLLLLLLLLLTDKDTQFPTYKGGSLAELAPEGDLGVVTFAGPLVEAQTLVEGGTVEVKGHGLDHVAGVLHPVQA